MNNDPELKYEGGDGTSMEEAVVIRGRLNHREGILAERAWLRFKIPGSEIAAQELVVGEGAYYDVIELKLPDGRDCRIWFNITEFFLNSAAEFSENPLIKPKEMEK